MPTSPAKAIYLFVFPGFADWEPAHALAELRRHGRYRVEVVASTRDSVVSMGGLTILPSRTIAELQINDVAAFLLPGGDRWEREPLEPALVALLQQLEVRGVPIAAICAATTAVIKAGILRGRRHTSNGLAYLQAQVPTYSDAAAYVDAPAVRDRQLVTASGLADVEFAREIFAELALFDETDLARWATYFRTGLLPRGAA